MCYWTPQAFAMPAAHPGAMLGFAVGSSVTLSLLVLSIQRDGPNLQQKCPFCAAGCYGIHYHFLIAVSPLGRASSQSVLWVDGFPYALRNASSGGWHELAFTEVQRAGNTSPLRAFEQAVLDRGAKIYSVTYIFSYNYEKGSWDDSAPSLSSSHYSLC